MNSHKLLSKFQNVHLANKPFSIMAFYHKLNGILAAPSKSRTNIVLSNLIDGFQKGSFIHPLFLHFLTIIFSSFYWP